MRQICVVATVALFCASNLFAQFGGQPSAQKTETIVYPVRAVPANDLAESLMTLYHNHQIIALDESNVLVIRVDADSRDEMIHVLEQLDRPKRTVLVHAYLLKSHGAPLSPEETAGLSGSSDEVLKRIASLQQADQLAVENRIEMTTLENLPASVQTGGNHPVLTGTTVSGSRGRANSYAHVQTGTMFTVTSRVTPDDEIVMTLDFTKSQLDRERDANDDDAPARSFISTLTHQSTVQLADGDALLAGTMVGKPEASTGHSYLVITARLRGSVASRTASRESNRTQDARDRRAEFFRSQRAGGASGGFSGRGGFPGGGFGGRPPADMVSQIARGAFERADRDRDGVLSGDELKTPGTPADKADADENGEVTFDELKTYISKQMDRRTAKDAATKPEPEPARQGRDESKSNLDRRYLQYYSRLLTKYDTNGDGKLNAEEWATMSKDPSAADTDEDGLITVEELTKWSLKKGR